MKIKTQVKAGGITTHPTQPPPPGIGTSPINER